MKHLMLLVIILLTACGGGGDGEEDTRSWCDLSEANRRECIK